MSKSREHQAITPINPAVQCPMEPFKEVYVLPKFDVLSASIRRISTFTKCSRTDHFTDLEQFTENGLFTNFGHVNGICYFYVFEEINNDGHFAVIEQLEINYGITSFYNLY